MSSNRIVDLSGRQFGRWTVVGRDHSKGPGQAHWICRCFCGVERSVAGGSLRRGVSRSCGCLRGEQLSRRVRLDLAGRTFGLWLVLSELPQEGGDSRWLCRCQCGTERPVLGTNLSKGTSTSCGCRTRAESMEHYRDLMLGRTYGQLKVLDACTESHDRWRCLCSCGIEIFTSGRGIRRGTTKSCGCLTRYKAIDRTGERFGKLLVLRPAQPTSGGLKTWVCQCDCGRLSTVTGDNLRGGSTRSCGCTTLAEILDERHCLYRLYDDLGDLLYVGIAVNVQRRFIEHQSRKEWWPEVALRRLEWFPDRRSAEEAETKAIREELPAFNIAKTR